MICHGEKKFAAEQRIKPSCAKYSPSSINIGLPFEQGQTPTSWITGNPSTLHKEFKPGMCFMQFLVIQNRAI